LDFGQIKKVGNYRLDKNNQGEPLGFTTLITPSKEKIQLHLEDIGRIIDTHKNSPQAGLIKERVEG
jgi:RNA-directed DNA polymerase